MKKFIFLCSLFLLNLVSQSLGQNNDTLVVKQQDRSESSCDVVADSGLTSGKSVIHPLNDLRRPTLPPMHIRSSKSFDIRMNSVSPFNDPQQSTNWDALLMPTTRYDYELTNEYLQPMINVTPLIIPENTIIKPLSIFDYSIPTRQELDVLQLLWLKQDVCDTTIYSCLDTTLNMTMEDLNGLLEKMTRKGFLQRELVSPRNEFNAFGVLIEMSSLNRHNRVYSYKTNIDRDLMRKFVDANAYLFREDSTIVRQKHLQAARHDSTLLRDLNKKIFKIPH
ncbi:hypothetical protein JXB12_07065 [candidate division KSB1 bacterium]|nr:hypothetical protein [candidate division KSB1 bacterium]